MNRKALEKVDQLPYLGSTQTNDETSMNEVKNNLAHSGTLSHNKASSTVEKQSPKFSYNYYAQQITCLVSTALRMLELDVDGGSG